LPNPKVAEPEGCRSKVAEGNAKYIDIISWVLICD
jgi:hypothetical protein